MSQFRFLSILPRLEAGFQGWVHLFFCRSTGRNRLSSADRMGSLGGSSNFRPLAWCVGSRSAISVENYIYRDKKNHAPVTQYSQYTILVPKSEKFRTFGHSPEESLDTCVARFVREIGKKGIRCKKNIQSEPGCCVRRRGQNRSIFFDAACSCGITNILAFAFPEATMMLFGVIPRPG